MIARVTLPLVRPPQSLRNPDSPRSRDPLRIHVRSHLHIGRQNPRLRLDAHQLVASTLRPPDMNRLTRKASIAKVEVILHEHGYVRRGAVWSWHIGTGVSGWLGLNTGRGPDPHTWLINPVIGVRHEAIECLVDKFNGPVKPWFSPTIASNYGHYREPLEYLEFTLHGDACDDSVATSLVDMLNTEGRAAVEPMADFAHLRKALVSKRIGIPEINQFRYPILLVLMGDGRIADEMAAATIAACKGKTDPGHSHLRSYFEAFLQWRKAGETR